MELGGDFTFVGRQGRLRVGDDWCRIDLLFFQRRLRCLVIIDRKVGKFDVDQMHLYLSYAREHWMLPGENPPACLILCAEKNHAVAKYALEEMTNRILAAESQPAIPEEWRLEQELEKTQQLIETRAAMSGHRRDRRSRGQQP